MIPGLRRRIFRELDCAVKRCEQNYARCHFCACVVEVVEDRPGAICQSCAEGQREVFIGKASIVIAAAFVAGLLILGVML